MTRLLRSEFYRLIRSSLRLVAVFVILVADVFLSTRCEVTGANMYQLPELCTMSQFTKYAENARLDARGAVKFFVSKGKLEDSQAEDVIGVFQDTHPWQFRWVLASMKNVLAEIEEAKIAAKAGENMDVLKEKLEAIDTKAMNENLTQAMESIKQLTQRLDQVIYKNQDQVGEAIMELNAVLENHEEFSQKIKNNPSALIRSENKSRRK